MKIIKRGNKIAKVELIFSFCNIFRSKFGADLDLISNTYVSNFKLNDLHEHRFEGIIAVLYTYYITTVSTIVKARKHLGIINFSL